jgi:hypothetical protein
MCVLCRTSFTLFLIILFSPVIHPDKCPHERAPEAFDILKKASCLYVLTSFIADILPIIHRLNQSFPIKINAKS